jgi:hypothetical protein
VVVVAEDLGELVADEGAVEALGGIELVAVAHGLGDAGEDGGEAGLGLFLDGGGEEVLGEGDAAAGRAGVGELLHDLGLGGHGLVADDVGLGLLGRDADARVLDQLLFDVGEPTLELLVADDLGSMALAALPG